MTISEMMGQSGILAVLAATKKDDAVTNAA